MQINLEFNINKLNEINAVSTLAEAEVQGMKLQMVSIQAKPNKQVFMMMMMGNTMMKMVFDGEKGSLTQQGMDIEIPDDELSYMANATQPISEIGIIAILPMIALYFGIYILLVICVPLYYSDKFK